MQLGKCCGKFFLNFTASTLFRALLNAYDFNVIFVDWSAGAQTINYVAARRRIRTLGPSVARFIGNF